MLDIRINRRHGRTVLQLDGHADFAPAGRDIVCAAAAAIVDTAAMGLEAIAKAHPDHVSFQEDTAP
jgi:uncharacterized protein YsxB (DUF464 family)